MTQALQCYRCGASLAELPLPLGRLDECPSCAVYVHCCRMCVFYDPRVPKKCREDDAEEVREKERANFCDYFKPSLDAFDGKLAAAQDKAKEGLAELFGQEPGEAKDDKPDNDLSDAEKLFK
jgi:hypothetical protein